MVVFKDCLLILVIVNDFAALVGLRGSLEVYQTARVLPVFKDMHNGIGRPLALIAGVVTVGVSRPAVMKDLSVLQEPPFTDQGSIVEIFTDLTLWAGIKSVIDRINANAAA